MAKLPNVRNGTRSGNAGRRGPERSSPAGPPSMWSPMESVTEPPPAPGWSLPSAPPPPLPGVAPVPRGALPITNGIAVAALVLGALALSFATNPALFVLAIPLGLAAVVCGAIGVGRANETGLGKGQSIAGMVTGGLGAAGGVVWVAVVGSLVSAFLNFGGTATTDPLPATVTTSGINCDGGQDRRAVPGELRAGDYTLTDVVVCSDFADDFAFSALVRNDGAASGPAMLELSVLAGGTVVGTGEATVTIAPGASTQAGFLSFDDYRSDWTQVTAADAS